MGNLLLSLVGGDTSEMETNSLNVDKSARQKRPCDEPLCDKAKQRRTECIKDITSQDSDSKPKSDSTKFLDPTERAILESFKRPLHINDLPYPILLAIFKNLDLDELLLKASLVCKLWRDLANDQDLWRVINLKRQLHLDDDILLRLTRLSDNINYLDVSDTKLLSDAGFAKVLENCTTVQTLKLVRCEVLRDQSFIAIGQHCRNLRSLNLENCYAVCDASLIQIAAGCPELTKLCLGSCANISSEGMGAIAQHCHNLRHLSLDQCCKVNDDCLDKLVDGCPLIECLCLSACDVTTQRLMVLAEFKHLRVLELARISHLRDACVTHLVRRCQKLESLNLSLCTHISDQTVEVVATHGKCMKRLYLVSCSLTDQALVSLAKNSKTIEVVDVGWCTQITDNGTLYITENCKTLSYLGLMRCDKVDDKLMVRLEGMYPHIHFSNMFLDCRRLIERARREGHNFSSCVGDLDGIGQPQAEDDS